MRHELLNNGHGHAPQIIRSKTDADERTLLAQQPVRFEQSWEENNLPEDQLNFKNLNMDDAALQTFMPRDKYNLVYITFLIHGIGVLMPWNMFITAISYFTRYKLSEAYIGNVEFAYASIFLQYLTFAAQVPNVIFNWMNIFVQMGGNLTTRIVWSISIEVVIFILTIALAMSDSSSWPGVFFWITMVSVVILNMANGIYQNTIFGMAAKLPIKYTGAVVLGSNMSGTFTSVVRILSDTFASNVRMSAIYYFITALFVLLVCFDTYFALPLNRFYRHHELKEQKEAQLQISQNSGRKTRVPYFYIFKKCLPQLWNIFFVFFCTLSIFPSVHANIQMSDPDFFLTTTYFESVVCFLTFNFWAMMGSFLAGFYQFPGPKYLWIPVALRVVFIPLFLMCNYQLDKVTRILPVLITNDWVYWLIATAMGLTSGYFSSLGMMYAPKVVETKYQGTAGMFAAAALITGIFSGICFAFIWPWFIAHVGY